MTSGSSRDFPRSTRRVDLTLERNRYAACGVGEYWAIDLFHAKTLRFDRHGESFRPPTEHRESIEFPPVPDCRIDLAPLWKNRDLLGASEPELG